MTFRYTVVNRKLELIDLCIFIACNKIGDRGRLPAPSPPSLYQIFQPQHTNFISYVNIAQIRERIKQNLLVITVKMLLLLTNGENYNCNCTKTLKTKNNYFVRQNAICKN